MTRSGRLTRMSRPDARRIVAALVLCALMAGCGSTAPSPPATAVTPVASMPPPSIAASPEASLAARPPTACYSLGEADCAIAATAALAALEPTDPAPIYLQVGPFSCSNGERCPATLAARPEGDVMVEFLGVPAIAIHLVAGADGSPGAHPRRDLRGHPPARRRHACPDPVRSPHELGHCGLYSGIDVDGTWWDPVGPIDGDHPDTINAAAGTIVFLDATHATFTSKDGLIVQLLRRLGAKQLPMCQ